MDKKKIANNILELMVNPTVIPVERRLYFRPEEILDNRSYEKAKMDSQMAYGAQIYNSDFYPQRNRSMKREVFAMDRRTLIAGFDILSQSFKEGDPIATELRTMAYAVNKMSEDELAGRLSEIVKDTEAGEVVTAKKTYETFKCPTCGTKVLKQTGYCVKCKKKVKPKEAAEEEIVEEKKVEEEKDAGKKEEKKEESMDKWSKEASDAVSRTLVSDIFDIDITEKKAGKVKGPGKPDGTGPYGGTEKCQMSEEKKEEKKEAEKVPQADDAAAEKKEEKARELLEEAEKMEKKAEEKPVEEKEAQKESEKEAACEKPEKKEEEKSAEETKDADKIVDTDILSSADIPATEEFEGIELGNPMVMSEISEIDESEKATLDQLFRNADLEKLTEDDKAKLDQLFK